MKSEFLADVITFDQSNYKCSKSSCTYSTRLGSLQIPKDPTSNLVSKPIKASVLHHSCQ